MTSLSFEIRQTLGRLFAEQPGLAFAVLVGSRAVNKARTESDWDIALQWQYDVDWLDAIARGEHLRRALASTLQVDATAVDLIDLRRANLTMRAAVAEEGVPLHGEGTLAWVHFLNRTWRDLEDFYWDKQHAA